MPSQQCLGYVLHRTPYRETSYIVDLFTRERGKLRGIAKGVRGSKGDRKSLLQSFQALDMTISGRNELKNIGKLEAGASRITLVDKPLYCAMYVNELLNRVLPEEMDFEHVFAEYQRCLGKLGAYSVSGASEVMALEVILREFECQLLVQLGYAPDFDLSADFQRSILAESDYQFVHDLGFVELSGVEIRPKGTNSTQFSGSDILAIGQQQWTSQSLSACKRLMRVALKPLLGEKPLKSRELFKAVR
ncbi:DNA repair protein RecO [Alteromonas oceanisediminis]|uniref:DNA repair protein RecO n=1 Tax=Alteromonas oceanisediminis TaxID=2836180 RepID=UPI001BD96E79|nr:DNA repair protein RecO [Alteromonas oceanisediminis]MBT0585219.1 DNA repair protein RecO [Alteromonas oceanisediminis]